MVNGALVWRLLSKALYLHELYLGLGIEDDTFKGIELMT